MSTTYVTVQGWVGSEVNYAVTPGGHAVATFRVGSTPQRPGRDGGWQSGETNWFTVKTWRHVADHVSQSVFRGQPIVVTGRLVTENWQRQDGSLASRQVIEASALGHDLSKGTSRFLRDHHDAGGRREDRPEPGARPIGEAEPQPEPSGAGDVGVSREQADQPRDRPAA